MSHRLTTDRKLGCHPKRQARNIQCHKDFENYREYHTADRKVSHRPKKTRMPHRREKIVTQTRHRPKNYRMPHRRETIVTQTQKLDCQSQTRGNCNKAGLDIGLNTTKCHTTEPVFLTEISIPDPKTFENFYP